MDRAADLPSTINVLGSSLSFEFIELLGIRPSVILFLAPLLTLKTAAMLPAERHVPFALHLSIPPRVFDFSSIRESPLVTRYSVRGNLSLKRKEIKDKIIPK